MPLPSGIACRVMKARRLPHHNKATWGHVCIIFKSCFGVSEAGPMPEDVVSMRLRPAPLTNHIDLVNETAGLLVDRALEMPPLANHVQHHLTATSALSSSQKSKDIPNGPTKCIPLSQRRVPPAKLNLTLDLSHPDYHLIPKSRAVSLSSSTDGVSVVERETEASVHACATGCSAPVSFAFYLF